MATAPETLEAISEIAGIPKSIPETVVRRLGEADLIPRGSKGRASPQIRTVDISRILIGVMAVSDGIEGTSAHVAKMIRTISSGASKRKSKTGHHKQLGIKQFVDPDNSFITEISHLMEVCSDPDNRSFLKQVINAIGLTFSDGKIIGWLEVSDKGASRLANDYELSSELGGGQRIIFGKHRGAQLPAMRREVRFGINGLIELADRTLGIPKTEATTK